MDGVWSRWEETSQMTKGVKWQPYPPSKVCGEVWWSARGWACLWACESDGNRGWVWAPLRVSDNEGASTTLSVGYSCITAPSWAPSLLQDWQLQWKILSTSLSTWGASSLSGQSRVTCAHKHTHTLSELCEVRSAAVGTLMDVNICQNQVYYLGFYFDDDSCVFT